MMKRIPLSNRIGCYCYLVYNRSDLESGLQNSDSVDVIYTVGFKSNHKSCIEVSNEEADHIEHPSLPIWLISAKNYISVHDGDFLRIHPITAEVIPSFNCCFRCEQCAYRLVKEQLNIWNGNDFSYQMSKDNMKLILTRLAEGGVRNIIFTGGGEPLCNLEGTLCGMSICKQLGLNFGIYTNGYFLDKEVSQKIISYNPEFIRVSIYGMDYQCFKKYTHATSESFTKVIGNIKQLIKQSRDSKSTTYIALSFLLHPNLYDNSEMIWKLTDIFTIEELKCFKSIRFTPAVDYDTNKQHSKSFLINL